MIVNIYSLVNKGVVHTLVDESTKHRTGDAIAINGDEYLVIKVTENEHIDYSSVVRINELTERVIKIDIDKEVVSDVHS